MENLVKRASRATDLALALLILGILCSTLLVVRFGRQEPMLDLILTLGFLYLCAVFGLIWLGPRRLIRRIVLALEQSAEGDVALENLSAPESNGFTCFWIQCTGIRVEKVGDRSLCLHRESI